MATREDQIPQDGETTESNSQRDGQEMEGGQEVGSPPDPFVGTQFEGKSPEYVARFTETLQDAVRQQREQLNSLAQSRPPTQPRVDAPAEKEVDFFENPMGAMRRIMEEQVAPIRAELNDFRARSMLDQKWDAVAARHSDFEEYRPVMQQIIETQNITPDQITIPLLDHLYYTAVGMTTRRNNTQSTAPTQQTAQAPRQHIPQHRPSSAPPPSGAEPKAPQLTEAERRLAREFGMNPAEYKRMQEDHMDIDDFAQSEVNNG